MSAMNMYVPESVSLSIYNEPNRNFEPTEYTGMNVDLSTNRGKYLGGYAIVTQVDNIEFNKSDNGNYCGALKGVSELLDPTTVSFKIPDAPNAHVVNQSYQFDLINTEKILDFYINANIDLILPSSVASVAANNERIEMTGKLLSHDHQSVILENKDGGIEIVPRSDVHFKLLALPAGLRPQPSLELEMRHLEQGSKIQKLLETTYKTKGITWRTDYNIVLSEDETRATVGAWVSILNLTGKSFANAKLKLIAGDVNVAQPPQPRAREPMIMNDDMCGAECANESSHAFKEKSFFEYHMYTLPQVTTINNASLKQLVLFPTAEDVKVEKVLMYQPIKHKQWYATPHMAPPMVFEGPESDKVEVYINIDNKSENNLGIALPKGKIRVFKEDGTSKEFVGEDMIEHTPRNEKVKIKLGAAFDVKAGRSVLDFQIDENRKQMKELVEFEVRNQKSVPSTVTVKDILYRWMNYEVECHDGIECFVDNHGEISFNVTVDSEEVKKVTYSVVYLLP